MSKTSTVLVTLLILAIAAFLTFTAFRDTGEQQTTVTSFEECIEQGNPVMESYPPRCAADGQTFTQDIGNELEKMDLIRIDNPRPTTTVSSPLEISGEARGTWYFEAGFPVVLYDEEGNEIASGNAQAQGNWMTEEFVPFSAVLEFEDPDTQRGDLILEKSNPSGLPENEDELRVPIKFDGN